MIERIKKHSGLIKLILMIVLSCVMQVVSLMKSSVVAGTFGVSNEMDSFNFANSIATFIFSFVIAGIATIVVPCYVKKTSRRNTDSFITTVFAGVAIVAVFVLLWRSPIISIITGRDNDFVALSGDILIVLIVSNLFSVFTSVTSAYFQYTEKFNLPKIIALTSQVLVIVFLVVFKNISVFQYALIIGAGIILHSLLDVFFALKHGWRYKPALSLKESETRELLNTFVPVLFSTGAYQLSLMIDSSLASRLNTGDVTILNYANQISAMVNTLLVSNLLIYVYPKLVRDVEQKKEQRFFWEKTYFFHAVMCLIVAGYAAIGGEGVSLLFQHGRFNEHAVNAVFMLSLIYIAAQPINVIRDLLFRYFYACGDTKSATISSLIATVVNVVASVLLTEWIGLYGIVVGTAISTVVSTTFIFVRFKRKFGFSEPTSNIMMQYVKSIAITAVTIFFVFATKHFAQIENRFLSIAIYGVEVVLIYVVLAFVFNWKVVKIATQI